MVSRALTTLGCLSDNPLTTLRGSEPLPRENWLPCASFSCPIAYKHQQLESHLSCLWFLSCTLQQAPGVCSVIGPSFFIRTRISHSYLEEKSGNVLLEVRGLYGIRQEKFDPRPSFSGLPVFWFSEAHETSLESCLSRLSASIRVFILLRFFEVLK